MSPITDKEARRAYDRERKQRKKDGLPPSHKPRSKRRPDPNTELEFQQLRRRFLELVADEPTPTELCAVCDKPRRPERSAKYARGLAELDAFCSTECARQFHGTPYPALTHHSHRGRPHTVPVCGTASSYTAGCRCERCRAYSRDSKAGQRARKKEAAA